MSDKLFLDYPRPWIPIREGDLPCCCCGCYWDGELAECGRHAYCSVCRGRGHDEDHECGNLPDAAPFHRLDHDCLACGKRHEDWDTCNEEVWRRYQVMKAEGRESLAGGEPWEQR